MAMNTAERAPNSATQTGVNQVALATPAMGLLGWWLSTKGVPPEAVAPIVALGMGVLTTLGTVFRNVSSEKGWTKYIG